MAETKMQLVDWLDDLTVRFLLNLPPTELSSVPRLCFQVEEAQWFYEDFIRPAAAAAGSPLPSLPLKQFCLLLFQHCPLLSGFTDAQHIAAYDEFLAYKVRVPVRGAIMMDDAMEKVILVKGWKKGASWSFPRGKINKDEKDLDCAIREVDEETGYDLRTAGLIPENDSQVKSIDVTMKEQQLRMFVFRGVPQNTSFAPKTRKEISKIAWYNLRDLPGFKKAKNNTDAEVSANKFYMVAPFLGHLKKWIAQQKRKDAIIAQSATGQIEATEDETTDAMVEEPIAGQHLSDRSTELKQLLSIGGSSSETSAYGSQTPSGSSQNHMDLLAMLRGASTDTQSSNSHQASHPPSLHILSERTSQSGRNAPPGHIESHAQPSPEYMPFNQQLQAQYPGYPPYPVPPPQAVRLSSGQPAPLQHLQAQSQFGVLQSSQSTDFPNRAKSPEFPISMRPQHRQSSNFNAAQDAHAFMPQGLSGQAIATGPTAPKASQLPPTRLTQHSMNLLDAFKGGMNPSVSAQRSIGNKQPSGPGNTHQNALLGLFRKPPTPQNNMQALGEIQVPSQPSEAAEKPQATLERRPTLNEITRTLPLSMSNRRSSASSQATAINMGSQNGNKLAPETGLAKTRDKEEPTHQQVPLKILQRGTSSPRQSLSSEAGQAVNAGAARGQNQHFGEHKAHLPSTSRSRRAGKSPNPARDSNHNTTTPDPHQPALSRGPKSPSRKLPSNSSRGASPRAAPAFQPQVLKRPKQDASQDSKAGREPEQQSADKTDQLLALFGKPSTGKDAERTQSPHLESHFESQQPSSGVGDGVDRQAHLLSLLSKPPPIANAPTSSPPPRSSQVLPAAEELSNTALPSSRRPPTQLPSRDHQVIQQPSTRTKDAAINPLVYLEPSGVSIAPEQQIPTSLLAPNPPSAPRLSPTTKSSTPRATQAQDRQQQLLNLFTQRRQATSPSNLTSPRTPISPFALPTPAQKAANGAGGVWQVPATLAAYPSVETGQVQDVFNRGTASNAPTPTNAHIPPVLGHGAQPPNGPRGSISTPVEHKDFLLGFLNGVVQREGVGKKH